MSFSTAPAPGPPIARHASGQFFCTGSLRNPSTYSGSVVRERKTVLECTAAVHVFTRRRKRLEPLLASTLALLTSAPAKRTFMSLPKDPKDRPPGAKDEWYREMFKRLEWYFRRNTRYPEAA